MSRWYYTPVRITKYLPTYPALCFQGCSDQGDMKHIWWTCPKVRRLWIRVYALVNTFFHSNILKDPWKALLHKPISELMKREHILATHIFMATKQTIAKANKKLTAAILAETRGKFRKIWQPWLDQFPVMSTPSRFLEL